ncbi:MAG TPA: HD-GYP domain-containing protein [Clostridia bacterium]|nr:HD-GYP domain-containing protein [Clostridia bacterium]
MSKELYNLLNEIRANYLCTVRNLANSLEEKDKYTRNHCERVTEYSLVIAKKMGLNDEELLSLEFAGLLHDIGKLGIPSEIINKQGILTFEEYELIKRHPEIGYDLLKSMAFLDSSNKILLQHHERIDGRGYPYGLEAQEIHKLAKILAVADAYDAMTTVRPYRRDRLSREQVINEFVRHKNTQFDENIVDIFVDILSGGDLAS